MLAGGLVAVALSTAAMQVPAVAQARSCSDLAKMVLPHATITMAASVPAGGFAPDAQGESGDFTALPAFCRVAATLTPTSDSDIKIEVWLPASGWNGKFQAVGNGAFSGAIAYPAMGRALARGYAAASTDTGHVGNTASFALGHPEKLIDFGWRAVHEMTVASKAVVAAHFGAAPKFSYWNGCSAGGRQAMAEAQRFPADFDGIIAGAPGLDWTGRAAQAVRLAQTLENNQAARLLQPQRQLLHRAVVDACDALDGVKDGLLENPTRCTFDPGVLQCKSAGDTGCLSPPQVETARLMYSGVKNQTTGREIAGLLRGSELGWTDTGWTASARATGLDQFRFIVFANPSWTVQQFNAHADTARAEEMDGNIVNALEPNLKPFIDRGGKLIQYHGWSDPQISPGSSAQYYARAVEASGGAAKVSASYRLFLAPGMGHCSGGEGPNTFDMVSALEQWVEAGHAPDQIRASHATEGRVDRTRPLCPYPQVAVYKGSGSIDEAASFACRQESNAQSSKPAANAWRAARAPDGHPDLQGIWTMHTFTPLVRPARYADQEFLTEKEAADLATLLAQDEVDPLAAGIFGATDEERRKRVVQNDPTHYDNALWLATPELKPLSSNRTSLIYDPPDGKIPPVTPDAVQRAAVRRAAGGFDSYENRPLSERCIMLANEGPPMLPPAYNDVLQIIQTPGNVLVIREMETAPRLIPTDGRPHVSENIRRWAGDSRGRWEGDTLVVDTSNFTDRTAFQGSSAALHVVERFTRVSADRILYQFTVDDPNTWTRPWSAEIPMTATKGPLYEYACHEGNYGMPDILRGARFAEREAAQGATREPRR
jgi:feruloyl esterase